VVTGLNSVPPVTACPPNWGEWSTADTVLTKAYVDATVNIHNPLTALLCFWTTPKIDSSNYTINSV